MTVLEVKKTYKLYIGGKFPRSESGRCLALRDKKGGLLANAARASVKDFREAALAARKAQSAWSGSSAFLRSQILYRVAEMLEGRKTQLQDEMILSGTNPKIAEKEIRESIQIFVHYAGWCDKYQQVFSSVNPVSSAHFNFSIPTPVGVVTIISPEKGGLLDLCSAIAPVIAGGNTCVVLVPKELALCALDLAEIFSTSDIPAGTINILTGLRDELLKPMASHQDIDSMLLYTENTEEKKLAQTEAADHMMRLVTKPNKRQAPSPYMITDFQETKTTWHPIGF